MRIHLQLFSILREKLPPKMNGQTELNLDQGTTLADLLSDLEITQKVVVSVNDIQVTDFEHELLDGDQVKLFSSISGG